MMMFDLVTASAYNSMAIALSDYIRSYVPKGWSTSIRNGNLVTDLAAKEAKELLHAHTNNESLETVMDDIDKNKPLSGFRKGYVREAITDFFQSREYEKSARLNLGA
jgi:hypothetical protein